MYEIWLTQDGYIQGQLVDTEKELPAAITKGKAKLKEAGFPHIKHERDGKDTWLSDKDNMMSPMGVIVEK